MKRREFISVLGGAAAWPLAAHAQQPNRVRWVSPDNKFITVIPYQEDDAFAIARLKNLAALTPTS